MVKTRISICLQYGPYTFNTFRYLGVGILNSVSALSLYFNGSLDFVHFGQKRDDVFSTNDEEGSLRLHPDLSLNLF